MKDDTARRLRNSGSEGVVRVSKFSSTILASCACLHPREVENDDIQYGVTFDTSRISVHERVIVNPTTLAEPHGIICLGPYLNLQSSFTLQPTS
jgi:hypothetical protein